MEGFFEDYDLLLVLQCVYFIEYVEDQDCLVVYLLVGVLVIMGFFIIFFVDLEMEIEVFMVVEGEFMVSELELELNLFVDNVNIFINLLIFISMGGVNLFQGQ